MFIFSYSCIIDIILIYINLDLFSLNPALILYVFLMGKIFKSFTSVLFLCPYNAKVGLPVFNDKVVFDKFLLDDNFFSISFIDLIRFFCHFSASSARNLILFK